MPAKKPKIAKELEIAANSPKDYKLLNKVNDYDHAVVDELVEAQNEVALLQGRINLLQSLIDEHKKYNKFIWQTAEGVNIAFHNLEDSHLTNILQHVIDRGSVISKELRAEALSRGLTVPVQHFSRVKAGWDQHEWDVANEALIRRKERELGRRLSRGSDY